MRKVFFSVCNLNCQTLSKNGVFIMIFQDFLFLRGNKLEKGLVSDTVGEGASPVSTPVSS